MKLDSIKFFLFGSFGKIEYPSDIDLLIIYDENFITIHKILSIRKNILALIKKWTNIPIDITLLNITEEKELNFIDAERATEL